MTNLKFETGASLKLKQLEYEISGWKRALVFMMDETIHLKSRFAEILKNKLHQQFLIQMEGYQNDFVKHDDLIGLLRNDIAILDKLLTRAAGNNDADFDELERKLFTIRNNVGLVQTQFDMMKNEFNSFLLQNL